MPGRQALPPRGGGSVPAWFMGHKVPQNGLFSTSGAFGARSAIQNKFNKQTVVKGEKKETATSPRTPFPRPPAFQSTDEQKSWKIDGLGQLGDQWC